MSEPKKAEHADGHAASSGGGLDAKTFNKYIFWPTMTLLVVAIMFVIILTNPDVIQNFINFIQALQIFFGIVIVFCFYKLQVFRKRCLAICHQVDHLYEEKNGQAHGHDHNDHAHGEQHAIHEEVEHVPTNIYEERFARAVKSLDSEYREEWRVGLIELDKLLKDLLAKGGYEGETIDELIAKAGQGGFSHYEDILLAHRIKMYLVKNMAKLPEDSDKTVYKNAAKLYKLAIKELLH